MNKKSKKYKKPSIVTKTYSGHRAKKHLNQNERKKRVLNYHRRSSSGTIDSVRSNHSLSIQEKGLSECSYDTDSFASNTSNVRYDTKERRKKRRKSFVSTNNDHPKSSTFRQWVGRFCILVGIVTIGVLGYIAVTWILEKTSMKGDPSLSEKTSSDSDLDKEDNFFAIDEITNFPSVSSYPTTQAPSAHPTFTKSSTPSNSPTVVPSSFPSSFPSHYPTDSPSDRPSITSMPSTSQTPSYAPTEIPTASSSPTVIEWYQVGQDISIDGVIFSSDISGNGERFVIGVPNHSNDLGKVEIYDLKGAQWDLIKTSVSRTIEFDFQTSGTLLLKYFGYTVRMSSDGNVVAAQTMTESDYNRIVAFEEQSSGIWRVGISGDSSLSFDLSDNRIIDYGHKSVGVIYRRKVCKRYNAFRICVYNAGGRDETLDMISDQNLIYSMSTSDSGSRVVVGRPMHTRLTPLPIAMSGRIDVYDLYSVLHPDTGALDLFASRVEKDGDQSKHGFLGSDFLERKGDVVKLSGDGSTVLVGGNIQIQYSNPTINSTVIPRFGLPYVEVWFYDTDEGWMMRGERLKASSYMSAWGVACAISTNGHLIAIGDELYNGIGFVKVFQYDGDNWSQLGQTFYGTTFERWGKTVAFSNSPLFPRLIITSVTNDNNSTVRVLEYGGVK